MNKPVREGFVKEGEPVEIEATAVPTAAAAKPTLELSAVEESVEGRPTYEELEAEVKRLRERLAPPPDEWPLVIKLRHRPIKAPGKDGKEVMINELSFREPRANDMIKAGGNPVRVAFMGVVDGQANYDYLIDDARMSKVMANLVGFQDAYLMAMDPRDYASAAYRLRRFFISDQGLW
jgi:Phage tail assembly chaperone proteins, E, or 41 or 14